MSIPLSNMNKAGGYTPPVFGTGYPSAPSNENRVPVGQSPVNYGFRPAAYAPVSQMASYGGVPDGQSVQPYPYPGPHPHPPYASHQAHYNAGGLYHPGYGVAQTTITTQPGVFVQPGVSQMEPQGDWRSIPIGTPNSPPGLASLTTVDQLLVEQQLELTEIILGFETKNKYAIRNKDGGVLLHAVEDTNCCNRNFCGPIRAFDMEIFDGSQNEIIHLYRPYACTSCCFPCCLQKLEVSAPPGYVIGSLEQEWSLWKPSYRVLDQHGDTVLRIEGPCCTTSMCGDVDFNIVTVTGESIGKISKKWTGVTRELFTDADRFGLSFPVDLDVRVKAVLLGATFLIDYMFFESQGKKQNC